MPPVEPAIIPVPTGVRVWPATGHTNLRKGFPGRALQVQGILGDGVRRMT